MLVLYCSNSDTLFCLVSNNLPYRSLKSSNSSIICFIADLFSSSKNLTISSWLSIAKFNKSFWVSFVNFWVFFLLFANKSCIVSVLSALLLDLKYFSASLLLLFGEALTNSSEIFLRFFLSICFTFSSINLSTSSISLSIPAISEVIFSKFCFISFVWSMSFPAKAVAFLNNSSLYILYAFAAPSALRAIFVFKPASVIWAEFEFIWAAVDISLAVVKSFVFFVVSSIYLLFPNPSINFFTELQAKLAFLPTSWKLLPSAPISLSVSFNPSFSILQVLKPLNRFPVLLNVVKTLVNANSGTTVLVIPFGILFNNSIKEENISIILFIIEESAIFVANCCQALLNLVKLASNPWL